MQEKLKSWDIMSQLFLVTKRKRTGEITYESNLDCKPERRNVQNHYYNEPCRRNLLQRRRYWLHPQQYFAVWCRYVSGPSRLLRADAGDFDAAQKPQAIGYCASNLNGCKTFSPKIKRRQRLNKKSLQRWIATGNIWMGA